MPDAKALTAEFARNRPETFAQVLGQGELDEIVAVLSGLPPELPAAIVARLSPSLINAVVDRERARFPGWLEHAPFDEATRLLARIPPAQAPALVNAVGQRTQRLRLQRHLNYPPHSLGSLVTHPPLVFSTGVPLDDVLVELKQSPAPGPRLVIVLDDAGRYAGALDPWRILARGEAPATAGDFLRRVPALHPETAAATAMLDPSWVEHRQLPVIDHERRLLGIVDYARLRNAVSGSEARGDGQVMAGLAQGFFRCASVLLEWILVGRRRA